MWAPPAGRADGRHARRGTRLPPADGPVARSADHARGPAHLRCPPGRGRAPSPSPASASSCARPRIGRAWSVSVASCSSMARDHHVAGVHRGQAADTCASTHGPAVFRPNVVRAPVTRRPSSLRCLRRPTLRSVSCYKTRPHAARRHDSVDALAIVPARPAQRSGGLKATSPTVATCIALCRWTGVKGQRGPTCRGGWR